jgi:hypothetical protein
MIKTSSILKQTGQSMVEYTVVLVFGVMVLTTGPGGDVMQDLLAVLKKNYEGYSYAISLSEPPDYDSATEYAAVLDSYGLEDDEIDRLAVKTDDLLAGIDDYNKDPTTQLKKLEEIKNTMTQVPSSVGDVLDGAGSFF